jgi:hypothetical protein
MSPVCGNIDIGHYIAQPSTSHTYDEITAHPLRAPEIILRGPWDEKVDIWTFGCLARRHFRHLFFIH